MKLSEAPLGARVVVLDNMEHEKRWTTYRRIEGTAGFNPNFVCAERLRCQQGEPGRRPRYDTGDIVVQTEMDGRVPVIPEDELTLRPDLDWVDPSVVDLIQDYQKLVAEVGDVAVMDITDPELKARYLDAVSPKSILRLITEVDRRKGRP